MSTPANPEPSRPAAAPSVPVNIDDSQATSLYANFARVSCNPEELILDFGLNTHPAAGPGGAEQIKLCQRVIMNHFTAKRLLAALSAGLQRHEQLFGTLELDVRKRVRN